MEQVLHWGRLHSGGGSTVGTETGVYKELVKVRGFSEGEKVLG